MVSKEPTKDTGRRREFKRNKNTARQHYEPAASLLGVHNKNKKAGTGRASLPWRWIQDGTCYRSFRSAPLREQAALAAEGAGGKVTMVAGSKRPIFIRRKCPVLQLVPCFPLSPHQA